MARDGRDTETRYFDLDDAGEEGGARDCGDAVASEGSGDGAEGEEGFEAGVDCGEDAEDGEGDADVGYYVHGGDHGVRCAHHI